MKIPFNKPFIIGNEIQYIADAVARGKISGDGHYSNLCQNFFEEKYGFKKCLLTTSCTDALEMTAILADIKEGDEVIMPSYTFVSTSNAFVLRGAKLKFVDSRPDHPGMDESKIAALITPSTKAIVVVHYAGVACNMDLIYSLIEGKNILIIEDAAQCIDSYYKSQPLGGIGHLAAFSFHETKNIISGEGGMLVINDETLIERAEIIREKGTNRAKFFRGQVDKYNWVDIGSSFLPSEIIAAFLYAQLQNIETIQKKRTMIWEKYHAVFSGLKDKVQLPALPDFATNNAHMYYMVCRNLDERQALIAHLKANDVYAAFHYQSLHKSPYYLQHAEDISLPHCEHYSDCLVRLPFYFELSNADQEHIINAIISFYNK
ncbi:MAG: dTDP-4-amino-4,6-dideoxygalactose transaminase [Bacteroidetes bacterium]|nr:dTDP-4-amino-4,6-dideoxygalactose transaminase [Bacteroidota bacterium]